MFAGAVVRRAVVPIAAALLFVIPAQAQSQADHMVEKFAHEADRAQARKAEAARKAAAEAKARKDAERKAAQASKALEVRRNAEAQRTAAEARRRAEETRAAEEEEMLARARREAEDGKATEDIRRLIEQAEAARKRAEEMLAQEAEQARMKAVQPSRPGVDEGLRRDAEDPTRKVTAEAAEMTEQARPAAPRAAESRERLAKLGRVRQVREARRAAQGRQMAQAQEAAQLALQHAAENRRLVKHLARVRELRGARLAARQAQRLEQEAAARATEVTRLAVATRHEEAERGNAAAANELDRRLAEARPPAEPSAPAPVTGHAGLGGAPSVTVLMIMTPGTYGIRRGATIADPILCTLDGCYVSAGSDSAAIFFPRRKALGVGNTLGGRAGACRQSLRCIFRDVALELPGALQPVDLHIFKHDRKRPQIITADSDCRLVAGRLACNRGIHAEDYVLWIIPERLAATAGPEVLERALRDGLATSRSAEVAPRLVR
ncbi:MAG: hypothetical protein K2X43_10500 [Hyphomonadaceae bacterium]|nr:hypothetical protein [Hyphomonadaceae bacterium]